MLWIIIIQFTKEKKKKKKKKSTFRQLRARRAQSIFKDVPLRTRRALSPQILYSDSDLLVFNATSLNINSALLALNWRFANNNLNPNVYRVRIWMPSVLHLERSWNLYRQGRWPIRGNLEWVETQLLPKLKWYFKFGTRCYDDFWQNVIQFPASDSLWTFDLKKLEL